MTRDDELLRREAAIWRRWNRANGRSVPFRSPPRAPHLKREDAELVGRAFTLFSLLFVELTLWGWDWSDLKLGKILRGSGELVALGWICVWLWGAWIWYPRLRQTGLSLSAGVPFWGLLFVNLPAPIRPEPLQPRNSSWSRSARELRAHRSTRWGHVVAHFVAGLVVNLMALAWLTDVEGGPRRRALLWGTAVGLHGLGWSYGRSKAWWLPFPGPLWSLTPHWEILLRRRDEPITRQAHQTVDGSRRWKPWDRLGRDLSRSWAHLPWSLRLSAKGYEPETAMICTDMRRQDRAHGHMALVLPDAVALGVLLGEHLDLRLVTGPDGELAPHVLPVLTVGLTVVLLGLLPALLRVSTRRLSLTRDRFSTSARHGTRLSLVLYLALIGLPVGLLLQAGDLRWAGLWLCLLPALLVALFGLMLTIRATSVQAFVVMRSAGLALGGSLLGMMAVPGLLDEVFVWIVAALGIAAPALHFLLWRSARWGRGIGRETR